MFDAIFNNIINTLIRDLPMPTRHTIAVFLFVACLLFLNQSFRKKNELHPIKVGWFVLFILTAAMSVLYVTL
ncbi:MAG: hypothetical protein PHC46_00500 [Clostridia bacterium]|nr:hypothetical protein [Clostridia bacterium]